ncbi:hypothetical protein PFBG_00156 [Plasmodium falciparum 7G8]|uniref:Erythrocyte membrane protein 1 n=2 Tax=Plasmodium falciparum TaxID=5833 RepID=W7FEX8_PLAF8|nr:hypothetical protein PFBG_00156 [Plasmodium falciparum 7G8]
MGSANSTVGTKIVSTNESEKSARNVLDVLAQNIRIEAEKNAQKYERFLKGELQKAEFRGAHTETVGVKKYSYSTPCYLDRKWNTNLLHNKVKDRDPCDGRNQRRFDENEGFECSKSRIKGNENKNDVGSCAPPRRRHICDKNLEALNESNTKNTHDLLGNVLVTAKYEGESIVNNHPHKGTSDVCTALARSFADIGDIVRGTDMFLGNNKEKEKIEKSLQNIFQNIKQNNNTLENLTDKQIREYWWALNRKDVWKALTCSAPYGANYYRKYSNRTMDFTSQGQCGHKETERDLPTNLDYVPQFLRWLNEWVEEFCRIKNIKIGNIKKSCTGESNNKHCSREGYDCNKTNLRLNEIFMDLECPRCADDCKSYETWVENKKKEFNKQKKKYEKEMDDTEKPDNKENGIYNKKFYDELKSSYKTVNSFFELLNKGPICQNIDKKIPMDYNNTEKTFSRAEHCKSCPMLGITCKGGQCNSLNEIKCPNIQAIPNIKTYKIKKPIDINMLVNNNKKKEISADLKRYFNDCDLFKKLEEQKWNCEYKCNLDVCELQNFPNGIDDEKVMLIGVLIKRWFVYFLTDYSKIKENLNHCINKEKNEVVCIKDCYKNCECVEKWITKKREEWQNIKDGYIKQYISKDEDVSSKLKTFLQQELFTNYVKSALDKDEKLDNMNESDGCNIPNKSNGKSCKKKDVITILLNRLEDKITTCKTQHDESRNKDSCNTSPKPLPRRRHHHRRPRLRLPLRHRRRRLRSDQHFVVGEEEVKETAVELPDETEVVEETVAEVTEVDGGSPTTPEVEPPCDIVEEHFKRKYDKNGGIESCNPKNYNGWTCQTDKFENGHSGACMPPRRQKLCVINLEHLTGNTTVDLREAFIKCAAAETFLSWQYYKSKNGGSKLEKELESGIIPEDFKRQMFYTFGDFRDFLFGTDISKNSGNIGKVNENINRVINNNKGLEKENDKSKRETWWKAYGPHIWHGMLCALTYKENGAKGIDAKIEQNKDLKGALLDDSGNKPKKPQYQYNSVKFSDNRNGPDLETFAKRPQFLRWFTEWGDEFCRERKKKEDEVKSKCTSDYEGCEKYKNKSNCGKACKEYEDYITEKKKQYNTQKEKFDTDKNKGNEEYENYTGKESHEYLKDKCIKSSCDCMDKVKEIPDYWEKPHKTYDTLSLQKKCSCPPPPCEIVDDILGDKSSKGYVEGCKTKYKTPRSEWECGKSSGEGGKGGNEDGDVVCIPPRRQRLYLGNLKTLAEGATQDDLRTAFIETAAIETFFSWHEFKKEKEREYKEQNEETYLIEQKKTMDKVLQEKLEKGDIDDEFKRQMFYTFGDYRDIFFGKDISNNMDTINQNISAVFSDNGGKNSAGKDREKWWKNYGPDIWEGMLCALSYDTETKKKKEKVQRALMGDSNKNKNTYDEVTFKGGLGADNTKLTEFVTRPQYFRWLEEWGEEFCRKRTYNLEKIEKDCRASNGQNHCDDDGFDCDEMGPNERRNFETLKCPSCAISCKSYKKWISRKKDEYDKQKEKYKNKIENAKKNSSKIYDENFVKTLDQKYNSIDSFLENLKEGPCCSSNVGDTNINFKDTHETFKHADYCSPCPVVEVKCKNGYCSNDTQQKCEDKTITTKDIKNNEDSIEKGDMLVSYNSTKEFSDELKNCCKGKSIFEGLKKDEWTCKYTCGLDICELISSDGKKGDKKKILIRALFKRWLETFLEDYNKIKDKISYCTKNGEGSKCIKGCKDKCDCVQKWIEQKKEEWKKIRERYFKRHNANDSDNSYSVKNFLEQGPFYSDVQKAIKPCKDLNEFEDLSECTVTDISEKGESRKKDVVECLLDKLKKQINECKEKHKSNGEECSQSPPNDTTPTSEDIPPDFPPPFCNVPPNPCSDQNGTNIVSVTQVAQEMQKEVHEKMLKRSVNERSPKGKGSKGDSSKSSLEGDLSLAKFTNGTKPSGLNNEKICDLDQNTHTNVQKNNRAYQYDGPCTGKNPGRFKIGTQWSFKDNVKKKTHPDAYMPQRREHMCTSNLENLDLSKEGLSNSSIASNSLLGDVLLAAKYEGLNIMNLYLQNNRKNSLNDENDKATVCRAMKYSFADIGDIIRGKDLWDLPDFKKLEEHLVKIFDKIKDNLDDSIKGKYTGTKHLELRADWWEANRDKLWEAMQCSLKDVNTSEGDCKYKSRDRVPVDDYIPQRLRWMTEWAEWYCKMQKEEYATLHSACRECKGGKCKNGDKNCTKCEEACTAYEVKIKPWRDQWEKIKEKYDKLYQKALNSAVTDDSKDEEDVVSFLKKLHKQNKDNKIYESAAGFIHQEAHISDCQKQTRFCKNPNGETPSSDEKDNDEEYAFSEKPYDHVEACACRPPSTPPKESLARSLPPAGPQQPVESDTVDTHVDDSDEEDSPPADDEDGDEDDEDAEDLEDADEDDDDVGSATASEDDEGEQVDGESETEEAEGEGDEDNAENDDNEDEEEEAEETVAEVTEAVPPQPAAPAPTKPQPLPSDNTSDILKTTIPFGIALALGSIAFLFMKKKSKSPVDLIRVLDIHKGDYGMPTLESKNRYIPYRSGPYKGKTYIYMEGDTSGDDDKYIWDLSSSDITSSESEYEEMDINDIYVPGSPKYKTLIEVILEPSKRDIPSNDIQPTNRFTDKEWSELKHDFISQYLPNTEPNTLYFDKPEEKPFITSIHDRDLYTGEEIDYNINMSTNSMDDPKYVSNNVYSGIDLINDTLSGNQHIDIYDEVLKRKENELFGTNYKKNTSNNSVARLTNSDPIMNQLDLLHTWLDRHRDMCEKWNKKEELLDKLNEQWNKDNDVGGDIPIDNRSLNTDVSIQIDMDDGKPKKEFTNMDTILDDMEDDIYYDVNDDENPFVDDIPMDHNKVDVPKKVHVEMKILNNTSNGSLEPEFPISDVWNI